MTVGVGVDHPPTPFSSVHNRADGAQVKKNKRKYMGEYARVFDLDFPLYQRHRKALDRALDTVTEEHVVPILRDVDKTLRRLEDNHLKVVSPGLTKLMQLMDDLDEANTKYLGPPPSLWRRLTRPVGR